MNNTGEMMVALANVAGAVGDLRKVFPADWDLDALSEEVDRIAKNVLDDCMNPEEDEPEPEPEAAPLPKAVKAAKAKAPKAKPEDDGEPAPQVKKVMGVCVDCGESYLKTGNSQKRCPACALKKRAEFQKECRDKKSLPSASEAGSRLERIKAIDRKMDTIPPTSDL